MKKLLSLMLAVLMLLSLAACGTTAAPAATEAPAAPAATEAPAAAAPAATEAPAPEPAQPRVITDMLGREVTLPDEINSIATFKAIGVLNTFVETLGAGDKICNGMTPGFTKGSHDMQYEFAPQIKGAPVLENADGEIVIEEVLALNPDLCLVAWEDGVKILEEAGMCVVYVNWTNGDELKEAVNLLGEVLQRQDIAKSYCEFFDATVAKAEAITADIPEEERVTALYGSVVNLKNPHKISNWWIAEAGGISVTAELAANTSGEAVTFTGEDILLWNPDVIFMSGKEKDDILADSNLAGVTAVKNEALYKCPTVGHSWGNRSTEQPLIILWAMNKMYPDSYSQEQFKEDVLNFYTTYFGVTLTDEQFAKYVG